MSSRPDELEDSTGLVLLVDQEPIRLDMALPVMGVVSLERMVPVPPTSALQAAEEISGILEPLDGTTFLGILHGLAGGGIWNLNIERDAFGHEHMLIKDVDS